MDFSCDALTSTSRPTLPPLHTLNLPMPISRKELCSDDAYDHKPCHIPQLQNTWSHTGQFSISSSVTSRSPSPMMTDYFVTRSSLSPTPSSAGTPPASAHVDAALKVRLVPCPFESADAYIYVPPSSTSSSAAQKVSGAIQGQLHGSQPLLLVGSAARQLRQPSQKIAKGARVHPYRITRTASAYQPPNRLH